MRSLGPTVAAIIYHAPRAIPLLIYGDKQAFPPFRVTYRGLPMIGRPCLAEIPYATLYPSSVERPLSTNHILFPSFRAASVLYAFRRLSACPCLCCSFTRVELNEVFSRGINEVVRLLKSVYFEGCRPEFFLSLAARARAGV